MSKQQDIRSNDIQLNANKLVLELKKKHTRLHHFLMSIIRITAIYSLTSLGEKEHILKS